MNINYTQVRLGNVVSTNSTSYSEKDNWEYVNYLDTGNITENKIDSFQKIDLSCEKLPSRARRKIKKGDVIYSTVRPIQKHYGLMRKIPENILVSTGFTTISVLPQADSGFIYYYLTQNDIILHLQTLAEQTVSTYPAIKASDIEALQLDLPPLPTQRTIAATLSCLDDKIELNNRINANLEAQAQAIFKSWFVDFEPFHDGEFVDSELGKIPKGWETVTLDDMCSKITDGSHFSPKDSVDGIYPMLSVKDMESYGFNYQSCKMIDANDYEIMISNDCVPLINDILVAKDGSYLKHIFIVNENRQEAILSSIAIFRPDPSIICPELLLCILKYPTVQQTIKDNYVSGSALPRIVLKDFKKLKLVLPPMVEQLKIFGLLSIMYRKIAESQAEINNLAAIRDALLPRLMSGEIEVED